MFALSHSGQHVSSLIVVFGFTLKDCDPDFGVIILRAKIRPSSVVCLKLLQLMDVLQVHRSPVRCETHLQAGISRPY